jgi:glycosyltransferase involved in cell wall biosynthesis
MTDSKKVLILGPAHPYRGGIAAFNERLAKELHNQGHEVIIFNFKFQYPNFLFPGKQQFTDGPSPQDLEILRVVHSINPFNWLVVRQKIIKYRPDLIICGYWLPLMSPCFSSVLHGLKSKIRVIGILHNVKPHESRIGDHLFTKVFLKRLNEAVVLSNAVELDLKEEFPEWNGSRRRLFHPIYDHFGELIPEELAKSALGLSEDKRYILFFGFVRKYKGLDLLIQAFKTANLPEDVELIIAGEFYDERTKYIQLIDDLNQKKNIHLFEGYIPENKVGQFFSAASCAALPYRHATQSGITQIAIHFLLPVISTRVGGIDEYISDEVNGILCEPEVESIQLALEEFFQDEGIHKMREGQELKKNELSWDRFTLELI